MAAAEVNSIMDITNNMIDDAPLISETSSARFNKVTILNRELLRGIEGSQEDITGVRQTSQFGYDQDNDYMLPDLSHGKKKSQKKNLINRSSH